MKKKYIVAMLLAFGVVLLAVSVVLTIIAAGKQDVIGGADLPTFRFVFFNAEGGFYAILAMLGCVGILAAVLTGIIKKKT